MMQPKLNRQFAANTAHNRGSNARYPFNPRNAPPAKHVTIVARLHRRSGIDVEFAFGLAEFVYAQAARIGAIHRSHTGESPRMS
jgi:hypothetical protein